jgi:hypothetical protein
MRKMMVIPAMALSLMTFGGLAAGTVASAHPVIHAGEDGDDTPTITAPSGGGGSSSGSSSGGSATPSGGIATGAGGTAAGDEHDLAPWLAAGAAGIALVGVSATAQRRRSAKV